MCESIYDSALRVRVCVYAGLNSVSHHNEATFAPRQQVVISQCARMCVHVRACSALMSIKRGDFLDVQGCHQPLAFHGTERIFCSS